MTDHVRLATFLRHLADAVEAADVASADITQALFIADTYTVEDTLLEADNASPGSAHVRAALSLCGH